MTCTLSVSIHPAGAGVRNAAVQVSDGTRGGSAALTGRAVGVVGNACAVVADCQNGNCVDGYCCDTAAASCAGCKACNVAGNLGTCSPIPVGTDPHNFCTQDCANKCDGAGACKAAASGTTCAPNGPCVNQNLNCSGSPAPSGPAQYASAGINVYKCDGTSLTCGSGTVTACSGYFAVRYYRRLQDHMHDGQRLHFRPLLRQWQLQLGTGLPRQLVHANGPVRRRTPMRGSVCVECVTDRDCVRAAAEPVGTYLTDWGVCQNGNCQACSYSGVAGPSCNASGWGNTCYVDCGMGNLGMCSCSSNADCAYDNAPNCVTFFDNSCNTNRSHCQDRRRKVYKTSSSHQQRLKKSLSSEMPVWAYKDLTGLMDNRFSLY